MSSEYPDVSARNDGRPPKFSRPALRRLLSVLAGFAVWGGLLFVSAGRLDWTRAWVYIGVSLLCFAANALTALLKNPEIIARRAEIRWGPKAFDKIIIAPYVLAHLVLPAVAGLDAVRFGWTSMPIETLYAGVILLVLGTIPVASAMATNPHLEKTVRIQKDRGHKVVTSGPYRIVRHPMYVGMIVLHTSSPLALGSAWAFAPAGAAIFLIVLRTAFEDRTLRRELPGYEEYAQRTRYRLLPGVW